MKVEQHSMNVREILAAAVLQAAEEDNIEKFTPGDVLRYIVTERQTIQLREAAETYARGYVGNFQFMRDMQEQALQWGYLTDGQAKGVLNCMLADARRARARTTEPPVEEEATVSVPYNSFPNGTYTVVMEDESHVTLRIKSPDWASEQAGSRVVQYLSGADNESSYTGFAFLTDRGFKVWRRFQDNQRLTKAAMTLLTGDAGEAGLRYALQSGRCWRCNRTLTVPASIHRGLGPDCAEIVGMA